MPNLDKILEELLLSKQSGRKARVNVEEEPWGEEPLLKVRLVIRLRAVTLATEWIEMRRSQVCSELFQKSKQVRARIRLLEEGHEIEFTKIGITGVVKIARPLADGSVIRDEIDILPTRTTQIDREKFHRLAEEKRAELQEKDEEALVQRLRDRVKVSPSEAGRTLPKGAKPTLVDLSDPSVKEAYEAAFAKGKKGKQLVKKAPTTK